MDRRELHVKLISGKMKKSIEEVINQIKKVLSESGDILVNLDTDKIQGVKTDQLPPDVAQMEADLFEEMLINFKELHGAEPTPETINAIRFIARAEAARRHTYRKLAVE